MLFTRANFVFGYLAATIGISDTTIVLQPGNNFPVSGNFVAVLWNSSLYTNAGLDPNAEFVIGTYASANTFTITRAQENTTAVPHAINDQMTMVYSAGVSTADLSILGTNIVNESSIATNAALIYDGTNISYNTPGISVTITTAKLTVGGSTGSMTFVKGILTAQVAAT